MSSAKLSKREIIIFFIVSVFFLLIPFLAAPSDRTAQMFLDSGHFKRMFSENILLLGFFFLNYFVLIPKLYFKKHYLFYITILFALFFIVYKLPEFAFFDGKKFPMPREFGKNGFRRPPPPFMKWSPRILMFSSLTIVSLFIRQNKRYVEIKEEKQLSEIAYLRAQINPHFLFNTLNNIYALTLQKSDNASDAVMKLSKMMRFVVTDSSKDFVPLQQDLDYIKNYIELQKLRLVNDKSIDFEIVGNTSDLKISPLLLINYIENAFKYGIIDDVKNPIKINISISQETLTMIVKNSIQQDLDEVEEKSEIGMKNTKKRLEYIYTNRYQLDVKHTEDEFFVELKLFLND